MGVKIIFGAQGSVLKVFCELDRQLRTQEVIEKSAYWISDSEYYFSQGKRLEVLSNPDVEKLFEWNFTRANSLAEPKRNRRVQLEKEYGAHGIWHAVLCDRRLMYGSLSKFRQSYKARYSHETLMAIVYKSLDALDSLVNRFVPNVIVTFVPATYGDYLLYIVAKARKIPYLQLRSTKVDNFVTFADDISALPKSIELCYRRNVAAQDGYPYFNEAQEYMNRAASAPLGYEGTLKNRKKSAAGLLQEHLEGFLAALLRSFRSVNQDVAHDNHVPPPLRSFVYSTLLKSNREKSAFRNMKTRMMNLEHSSNQNYLFYPMHSEPEIALMVYGRDSQNQIETIRRLAQALPFDWKLVVKEHPRSFSYRSDSYYKRLLEIPNLWFAQPDTSTFYWIRNARIVATVSGFTGFEAVVIGRPVVVLGDVSYSVMPDSMVRKVDRMSDLGSEFRDLIRVYQKSDKAIKAFIAACMEQSVAVNLYSELLAKSGRTSPLAGELEDQYQRLCHLFAKCIQCHVTQ